MRINEVQFDDSRPVEGYGPGFFRIGGEVVQGSVLLLPSGVSPWAGYHEVAALTASVSEIDVLFVGTGAEIAHLPSDVRQVLEAAGLGVEAMSTPSACRTYNVLLSEGRRVGAALIAV
ncbi:MAG: Mth938-like domain-containing protein [Pseudomonadota bacterium]